MVNNSMKSGGMPFPSFDPNNFISAFKDVLQSAIREEVRQELHKAGAAIVGECERIDSCCKEFKEKADEAISDFLHNPEPACVHENERRIIVSYVPQECVVDSNYAHVEADEDRDEFSPVDDAIAMIVAAANRVAESCEEIDADDLATDLLWAFEEYMKEVVVDQLVRSEQNGK